MVCQFKNGKGSPPATSKAGARWPRFSLIVIATTSCRDNKVQMIRPQECKNVQKNHTFLNSCIIWEAVVGLEILFYKP
jgi:hypothetical protein